MIDFVFGHPEQYCSEWDDTVFFFEQQSPFGRLTFHSIDDLATKISMGWGHENGL